MRKEGEKKNPTKKQKAHKTKKHTKPQKGDPQGVGSDWNAQLSLNIISSLIA